MNLKRQLALVALLLLFLGVSAATQALSPRRATPKTVICTDVNSFNKGRFTMAPTTTGYQISMNALGLFKSTKRADLKTGTRSLSVAFPAADCTRSKQNPMLIRCVSSRTTRVQLYPQKKGPTIEAAWVRFETELITRQSATRTRRTLEARMWIGPANRGKTSQSSAALVPFKYTECTLHPRTR